MGWGRGVRGWEKAAGSFVAKKGTNSKVSCPCEGATPNPPARCTGHEAGGSPLLLEPERDRKGRAHLRPASAMRRGRQGPGRRKPRQAVPPGGDPSQEAFVRIGGVLNSPSSSNDASEKKIPWQCQQRAERPLLPSPVTVNNKHFRHSIA